MNILSDQASLLAAALPAVFFLAVWAALYFAFEGLESRLAAMAQLASAKVVRGWLAKWALAHPRWQGLRSYAPIFLVLALGGIAAFVAGEAFVELAEHFRLTTSAVYRADHAVNAAFQNLRYPGFTTLLDAATIAGSPLGMALVVVVAAGVLLLRRQHASAGFVVAAAAGGALLNLGLKTVFERVRPPAATAIAAAQGYSFPSGHAMGSLIVLGSIGYVALRLPLRWKVKSALLAALATAVVLIGLSRVYLGVHWLSDIAGGWSAGAVWLATATVAFETLLRIRQLRRGAPPPGAASSGTSPGIRSPGLPSTSQLRGTALRQDQQGRGSRGLRLGFCAALAGVGLAAQPAAARQPQWVQATPFGGPILDLKQATSSADALYAVTDSGDLYASTDGARTWSARSSPGNGELKYAIPGALVVDPRHADTLYALTGWAFDIALLLRSVDGGRSWTNLDLAGPLTLTVDHENPLELWAGTASGLYLSTDQGEHWKVVAFQDLSVDAFSIDPFDAQNFVLSLVDGSAWRSTDRGLTWQPVGARFPIESSMVFDVVHPGVIYAFNGFGGQTMRSRDGGRSWSTLPLPGVDDLASSPDGTLYAASYRDFFGVLASRNLGSRWLPPPTHREFGGTEPADFVNRVIVSGGSPDVLFAAGRQGIWRSTDRGASWLPSNEGLVNPTIDMVWADPSGRPGVFATAGGVFHSTDGGASWMLLANAFQCFADDACGLPDRLLASDPRAPQSMYGFGSDGQADYLAKSTDGGRNWSKLPFPIGCCYGSQDGLEMTAFYLDPRRPDTVFVGGYTFYPTEPFLTRSDDGGRHWRVLTPPTQQEFLGIVGGPSRTLYGLTCVGLFVSSDHGETWQTRGQGLPAPAQLCPNDDFGGLPLLLSDPQDSRTLYVGTPRQGIYRSVDGGSSFEPFGHGLETARVGSLVVDPANPRRLYAGVIYPSGAIEPGIYGWNAVLDEWSPLNGGLPPGYFTGIVTLEGTDPSALYTVAASGSVYRLPIP